MKKIIRKNIEASHSLHDMNVTALEITENDIVMKLQYGMVKIVPPYQAVEGFVEFHNVDFDFCCAYVFDGAGNTGNFSGRKMSLKNFITEFQPLGFVVIDETYGYNMSHFGGFLSTDTGLSECKIEISHMGDMVFVETE